MGIKNLLRILKPIVNQKHLRQYSNMKLAIDGYAWLHKSMYSMKSVILDTPDSTLYLNYLLKRIEQLLSFKIKLIVVLDGNKLPMKENEEMERERHRQALSKESEDLFLMRDIEHAKNKKINSIDINPKMAFHFIKLLRKMKIEYYVAPYEADAQLAYLSKANIVDGVITEDSDILALGCKRVLLKLDYSTCMCEEILYNSIKKQPIGEFDFCTFDEDKFVSFCILCGCDYFKVKGVGPKNAYIALRDTVTYKEAFALLKKKIPKMQNNLESIFEKAFLTFKFQVIYCPIEKRMRYFNDMTNKSYACMKNITDYSFLGTISDNETTAKIVFGQIDPITHQPFESSEAVPWKCSVEKSKWKKKTNSNTNNNTTNNNKPIIKEVDRTQTRLSLDMFKEKKTQEDINPNIITKSNYVITKDQNISRKLPNIKQEKVNENDDNKNEVKQKVFRKRKYDDYLIEKQKLNIRDTSNDTSNNNNNNNKKNQKKQIKGQYLPNKKQEKSLFKSLIDSFNFTQSPSIDSNHTVNSNDNTSNNSKFNQMKKGNANGKGNNMIKKFNINQSSIVKPIKPFPKSIVQLDNDCFSPMINSTLFKNPLAKEDEDGSKQSEKNKNEPFTNTMVKSQFPFSPSSSFIKAITESTKVDDNCSQEQKQLLCSTLLFDNYNCKVPEDYEPFN